MYVVRQVRRCMTRQRREDKTCQFEVNSTLDWKPVQLAEHWRHVTTLVIQSGLFEERPIFPIAFMLHERKFQKLHEDFCTCLSEMLPSAFQGQPINICMDGESEVAFSRSTTDTVEEVARSLLVVHVPQQQIFSVSNPAGVVHCVKLFPKESCTCQVGTICCHILAAKYSIGMIGNQERRINLAQLRRNSRKRNDKKSGPRHRAKVTLPSPRLQTLPRL